MANVRDGIDYSETIHNYLSTRPAGIIMNILQVVSQPPVSSNSTL